MTVFGSGGDVRSVGHIEDVAEGFAKVVEADAKLVSGEIFHFAEAERCLQRFFESGSNSFHTDALSKR